MCKLLCTVHHRGHPPDDWIWTRVFWLLCKRLLYQFCNFILYFVSLLLTSPYFRSLLEYSAHFRSLVYIIPFWPILPKNVPDYSSNMTFYWRAMSDSRMIIVPILTWLIQNTSSVNWNLLVRRVATIHKKAIKIFTTACQSCHERLCLR